jgi:ribosomal protein L24
MVNDTTEDNIFDIGDTVRLRSGAYAGQTGIVMRVYPYNKDQGLSDALVLVRLANGRNNSCYMSNLEKMEEPPSKGSLSSSEKGEKG